MQERGGGAVVRGGAASPELGHGGDARGSTAQGPPGAWIRQCSMYGRSAERERWSERGDCEAAGRQSHGGAVFCSAELGGVTARVRAAL